MPTLDQWEGWLSKQINPEMNILAEVGLNRTQHEEIAEGVRALIRRYGINRASGNLFKRLPLTFVTLLSGFAAYNTKQNYWGELADYLQTGDVLFTLGWNREYVRIIQENNLLFFSPDDFSKPYIKTIRLQGGIPAYSLPDFFEKMLLPSVERPELREIPSDVLLKAMIENVTGMDQPVKNFFFNSDAFGIAFFESCRKLALHYNKTKGEVLPAAQLRLPEYVIEGFVDFIDRTSPVNSPIIRPRRPVLLAAPYREEAYIWVRLPEEEIPLHYAERNLEWRVSWPGLHKPERHPCTLNRRRQAIFTEEAFLPVTATARQVTASLYCQAANEGADPEALQSWTLPLQPPAGRAALLAFRAKDGVQIRPSKALPETSLILLFPGQATLNMDGAGMMLEDYGNMGGGWRDWQMQTWDLAGVAAVHVLVNGLEAGLPAEVAARAPDPELSGGNLFPFVVNPSDPPLYLGTLPVLQIPLGAGEKLEGWKVQAKSVWNTQPVVDKQVVLSCLGEKIVIDGVALLDLRSVLGGQPVGTFELAVHGPGKVAAEFRLRCWPKLDLQGLPGGKFNPAEAAGEIKFKLRLPKVANCEPQAGASGVRIERLESTWQVVAAPEVTHADLNLIWPKPGGEPVRVPLTVPIARLRWALTLEQKEGDLAWTGRMLQKSVNVFLQSQNSAVHVEMYGLGGLMDRLRLELVDLGDEHTIQTAALRHTAFSQDWLRVSLAQFKDTLNASREGRLDLVYAPYGEEPVRIPLVLFFPQMEINKVQLSPNQTGEYQLTWQEEIPLKNRRVVIYPAWKPWSGLKEYKISDEVHGHLSLGKENLPATRYHVLFFIAPSWEPPLERIPKDADPVKVDLCPPLERLEVLKEIGESAEAQFCALLESACILHDLGQKEERNQALDQCKDLFDRLPQLDYLTSMIDWMEPRKVNRTLQSFIWRYMFKPKIVDAAFQRFPAGHPFLKNYLNYAARAPQLYAESAFKIAIKADDPVVVYACLRRLLEHESELLILLIQDMIQNARLSENDAIEILAAKPVWALTLLCKETSETAGRLIACLIPKVPQDEDVPPETLDEWIVRALPFVDQESVRFAYLSLVITSGRAESYPILMHFIRNEKISMANAEELLSKNISLAFSILSNAPVGEGHTLWLERLCRLHPELSGEITVGNFLKTPIGVGKIVEIKNNLGKIVMKARLKDPCLQIVLEVCKESPVKVYLDMGEGKIIWLGQPRVWKCEYCEFRHPNNNLVDHHMKNNHPYQLHGKFIGMPPYSYVTPDEIEFSNESW